MVFEENMHMNSKANPNQGLQQSIGGSSYYLSTAGDLLSSNSELNSSFQEKDKCARNLLSGLLADRPRSGPPLSTNFNIHESQISGTISQELFDELQNSVENFESADFDSTDDFKVPQENFSENKVEETDKEMIETLDGIGNNISLSSPPKPSWMDTIKNYAESIHPVDCVVVVEECRPLSGKTSFMTTLKTSYLQPLLKQLNGGPETNIEFGCDIYTSLYSLVTFSRSNSEVTQHSIPNTTCDLPGTPLIYKIFKKLDELQHEPMFSPNESVDILPVLEKIIDRFEAFDNYRRSNVKSERYLMIVTVSDFCGVESSRLSRLSEEYRSSPSFDQLMELVNLQSTTSLTGPPLWPTSFITGDVFASTCNFHQRESIILDSSNDYSDCLEVPVSTPGAFPSVNKESGSYDNVLKRTGSATDTGALTNSSQIGQQPSSNSNSMQEQAPSSVISDNVHTPQSFIAASPSITQPNTPHTETPQHNQIIQQQIISNEANNPMPPMNSGNGNSVPVPPRNPTPHMKSNPFHSTTPSPTPVHTSYQMFQSNIPGQRPIAPANQNVHPAVQRRPPHFQSPTPMTQNSNMVPVSMMNQPQMMEKAGPIPNYSQVVQGMEPQTQEYLLFDGHLHLRQTPGNVHHIQIYSPHEVGRLNEWNNQAALNMPLNKNSQVLSNLANNSISIHIRMTQSTRNILTNVIDANSVWVMMPLTFNANTPLTNLINFICLYKSNNTASPFSGFIPRDQTYFFNELKRHRASPQQAPAMHTMPQSNFTNMPPQHSQMVQQAIPPQYNQQYQQRSVPMTSQQVYSSVGPGGGAVMHHPTYMTAPQSTTPDHNMMPQYNKAPPPQRMMQQQQQPQQQQQTNRMRPQHEPGSHHPNAMPPAYQHQHGMAYQMPPMNSQMPNPAVMQQGGGALDLDYSVKFDNKTGMPYP